MNERLLISTIRQLTGTTGPDDRLTPDEYHRVLETVKRLSRSLNHERSIVENAYLNVEDALLGYVSFFLPRSYAQFRYLIGLMGRQPERVLDLGSGPGPATLAAFDAGADSVLAVDHSSAALDILDAVTERRAETLCSDLQETDAAALVRRTAADTVVTGHVMNELWSGESDAIERRAALLETVLEALPPGGRLLVVDPALRQTSRDLLAVRDRLADAGFAIFSPCLRHGPCPARNDERDWCHGQGAWEPSPLVARLAEDVGVRNDVFKMTHFLLGRRDERPDVPAGRTFRIVSEPLHTKGRLRYYGCGTEGRLPLVMKERDASGEAADFAILQRYDVVRIGATVEKGDGLVIQKGELARRIARADEPLYDREGTA